MFKKKKFSHLCKPQTSVASRHSSRESMQEQNLFSLQTSGITFKLLSELLTQS